MPKAPHAQGDPNNALGSAAIEVRNCGAVDEKWRNLCDGVLGVRNADTGELKSTCGDLFLPALQFSVDLPR